MELTGLTELTDEQLAGQPAGYWTGEAHTAVIAFIAAEHAKLGVTQRHWMTLNRLAVVEGGLTRDGLTEALRVYMTPQIGDVSTYGRSWTICSTAAGSRRTPTAG